MKIKRVLVIGGGIGGLSAAIALTCRGVQVNLIERRSEFKSHGVGLGLPGNALRALKALGVLDEVLEAGYEFDHLRVYDRYRKLIVDHRFRLGGDGVPAFAALARGDLHCILLQAARIAGVQIYMGTEANDISNEGEHVQVRLSDGNLQNFDFVIGFDGINSSTRHWLFGNKYRPKYSGYAAWRLITERPDDVTGMEFHQGVGNKAGVMPLSQNSMYLFYVYPEPGNPYQDPDRFCEILYHYLLEYDNSVVASVRDRLSHDSEIVYSPIETLLVPTPWYRGRIMIAGDAAHTVPPHFTQGAGMAIEDAVTIAEELCSNKPVERSLEDFMERRFNRCQYVSEFAKRMLEYEQSFSSPKQIEASRNSGFDGMDKRLTDGDIAMNVAS